MGIVGIMDKKNRNSEALSPKLMSSDAGHPGYPHGGRRGRVPAHTCFVSFLSGEWLGGFRVRDFGVWRA